MGKLDGKVVLITGGSSGIGEATARLFAAEGATVIATGSSQQSVEAARARLPGVELVVSDASSIVAATALVKYVTDQHGRIDMLFANAGIARLAPAEELDEALFDDVFNTNLKGVFFLVQRAAAAMPDGGAIVLTGSVAGSTGGKSGTTAYGASKAALRSLSRTLGRELAPRNIRVNTVSPGPILTALLDRNGYSPEERADYIASTSTRIPLGRMGAPEEVAKAVLFMSADATFTTGAELMVDGGMVDL